METETTTTTTTTPIENVNVEESTTTTTPVVETKVEPTTTENVKMEENTTNTTTSATTTTTTTEDIHNNKPKVLMVFNLSKFMDGKKFIKFLDQHQVPYKKSKKIVGDTYGSLNYENEEQRGMIIEKLSKLKVGEKYIKVDDKEDKMESSKKRKENPDFKPEPLKSIEDICSPWHKTAYEDQLKKKEKEMKDILTKMRIDIRKNSEHNLPSWLEKFSKEMACPLETITPSATTQYYRNKASYTIGYDLENTPCVGFALGKTGNGVTAIGNPQNTPILSLKSLEIRKQFEDYIKGHARKPYDKPTHTGFWRQLTVRDFTTGESMATIQVNHKGLSAEEIEKEKQDMKTHFQSLPNPITSFSIQLYDGLSNAAPVDHPFETVFGPDYIHEQLLGYKFRVSYNSFFQVNTKTTELLYSKVLEWANVSKDTILLDVCCGTGTIGQCVSSKVKKVIGLEISPDAIQDSIANAKLNNIENAEYILGKAEDTLPGLLKKFGKDEEYVGIVDPPRSGLHGDVIKAMRAFETMKKFVYVSCKQTSLVQDAIKFCKGISKTVHGTPFRPTKAIAFDLFPHTENCELVVLFERIDNNSSSSSSVQSNNTNNNISTTTTTTTSESIVGDKRKREEEDETTDGNSNTTDQDRSLKIAKDE